METGPAGQTVIMTPASSVPLLAWLAVVEGPGAPRGRVFSLAQETVIGRKTGQVVLAGDAYVSGQHAKVRLESGDDDDGQRSFFLYDLASANGTFAGNREDYRENRIYRQELRDGDFILLGETTLVFKQVELPDTP
jgi:pSer/pThr/pTyr-binding forkhead associated (FHA) protein